MIDKPFDKPKQIPPLPQSYEKLLKEMGIEFTVEVPSLTDIGRDPVDATTHFVGGETVAL